MDSAPTAETIRRANELYWDSNRSVNQIADDLELSKGALYGLIEPLVAGGNCPRCASDVVFSNRTAKERGRLDCPTCDWEGTAADLGVDGTAGTEHEEAPDAGGTALTGPLPGSARDDARFRTIAGGALLGAAVGLALVMWTRRRP